MDRNLKTYWKERTVALLEESFLKNPELINTENVAMEAARLIEASSAILFSVREDGSLYIEAALDHKFSGRLVSSHTILPSLDLEVIYFKKISKAQSKYLSNNPYILSLPLKFKKSNKLLVLGFEKAPKDKKGMMQWSEMLQAILLASYNNRSDSPKYIIHPPSDLRSTSILKSITDVYWSVDKRFKLTSISPFLQEKIYSESGFSIGLGSYLSMNNLSKYFLSNGEELIKKAFNGEHLRVNALSDELFPSYEYIICPIKNIQGEIIEVAVTGNKTKSPENSISLAGQTNLILKGILTYLPVIIFRVDADGNFSELTGAGLRKLNIENNEMVGKTALKVFPDLKKFIPTITTGTCQRLVIRGAIDGTPRVFKNYTFPDKENRGGIVGFAIDITEQDSFEQGLKRSKEQAESASLAKSHFLANQSHEIRTPINAILGFAQLMKNNIYSSESEEYLDYILSSGQILLNLIGNVLDLTKIEEGKLDLVEVPFPLQEVIISNLHPYIFQAKEKGLEFDLKFDSNLPKYILGDAGKIIQIIINLIGNSLKFTKEGQIKVAVKSMAPALEGEKIWIEIAVSDTGIGIPIDQQPNIFKSFTQADSTIGRKYGGTGLGLSIVKALTELMKGGIDIKSPGELLKDDQPTGTTFSIKLPLRVAYPPFVEVSQETEKEINYQGQLKILLVDDNYLNLKLASTMLNNLGCEVTVTHNGQEALSELANTHFDLVFMDVQMPVMDGYETTKLIRKKLKLDIPIIGLSANVYKEDIDLCYESGMDDYLSRPYTIKSFHEKVFKWAPYKIIGEIDKEDDTIENPPTRLTNLAFLEQVFNGDKEKVIETVKDFMLHNEEMINILGEAIDMKDYSKIATVAHNIRSSLQTVGLDSLYEVLSDIESISKGNKNVILLEKYYQGVKEITQRAYRELEESLMVRQR
jgi:signal transduction histidine kinase/CheY-like chemotaxis protein/HPt (histidine-containing phosphotransfer) domain-containing protein